MATRKARVLFLCTGNSCRSQMAEAWANQLGGELLEARSAGSEAHGKNANAIAVMREAGVDIAHQESKVVTPELLDWADLIVTVCSHADETCPVPPPNVRKDHWPLSDPAKARGKKEEVLKVFRATRDEIRARVLGLLASLRPAAGARQSSS